MHTPHDEPRGDDTSANRPLEGVLAAALQALEAGGEHALERFLDDHADQADELRFALAELRRTDLLLPPRPDLPGHFGEFRIHAQLGAGGMGVVYLAEQTSLGREVALKVVRPELLFFEGARERFRREIDAVAKLEHPAIVPILATGTADDIPYYAMPRIRGHSADAAVRALASRQASGLRGTDLLAVLADTATPDTTDTAGTFAGPWWHAVVRLVRQAALGIHHAHTRGILHRDLKPSNLMLTADGRAIVLDFGLALARGDSRLTRTGSAAGSPAFMAPEQVRGEAADERTDVYGLAATLHCLLTLRPPFAADDPEVLRSRILAGTREDGEQLRALPMELRLVLATAMDRDRVRRYGSAASFADDLQAVLDGRPILARALPMAVRLRRFAQRHRVLATAVFASAVFVVVLPSVLLWQQHAANEKLAEQVRRSDASVKVSIDAVEKLLANVAADRLRNLPAAQEVAARLLRSAITLFEQLADDPAAAVTVHNLTILALEELTVAESSLGRRDAAIAAAERGIALCEGYELFPRWRLVRAELRRQLAAVLLDGGPGDQVTVDRAAALIDAARAELQAIAAEPGLVDDARSQVAHCEGTAARIAKIRGDVAAVERGLRAAVAASDSSTNAMLQGVAKINLVRFLKETGRFDEALRTADEVLAATMLPGPRETGWPVPRMVAASAHLERSLVLYRTGRFDEAAAAARLALELFDGLRRDYPDEPSVLRLHGATANGLALLHTRQHEWAAARPLLEVACDDQTRVLAHNQQDAEAIEFLTNHRRTLAVCLYELDDLPALEPVARALGQMAGQQSSYWAAVGLLRCADRAEPRRAAELRTEAVDLLVESSRRGRRMGADDPRLEAVRNDPRLQQILVPKAGG